MSTPDPDHTADLVRAWLYRDFVAIDAFTGQLSTVEVIDLHDTITDLGIHLSREIVRRGLPA